MRGTRCPGQITLSPLRRCRRGKQSIRPWCCRFLSSGSNPTFQSGTAGIQTGSSGIQAPVCSASHTRQVPRHWFRLACLRNFGTVEPGTFLRCQSAQAIRARDGPPVPFRPCGQCGTRKPSVFDPALVAVFFPSVFILFSARHRRQDGLVASGSEGGQVPTSALAHTPPLGIPNLAAMAPNFCRPCRHACQPETQPPPNPGTRQDMARDTGNMTQPPAQYKRATNPINPLRLYSFRSHCCRCSDIVRNKCRLPSLLKLRNTYPKKGRLQKKACPHE